MEQLVKNMNESRKEYLIKNPDATREQIELFVNKKHEKEGDVLFWEQMKIFDIIDENSDCECNCHRKIGMFLDLYDCCNC